MQVRELTVVHLLKSTASVPQFNLLGALHLNSCQRVLWVFTGTRDLSGLPKSTQVFQGTEAYSFLLRVATGLESQVLGETDIFGQLKEAWRKTIELESDVDYWIQKIFEDTKEIRSRHLQNLGGASYGTLARKLLKEAVTARGPVLIVGAGQLARSVVPYLLDSEIWLINRNRENLRALHADFKRENPGAKLRVIESAEEESQAWAQVASAVVCIPVSATEDSRRIAAWSSGTIPGRVVLHLGALKNQSGGWKEIPNARFLDDLFELQKTQGEVRSLQVAQAVRACHERAKLRALGDSVSTPHGWEDLAVFV